MLEIDDKTSNLVAKNITNQRRLKLVWLAIILVLVILGLSLLLNVHTKSQTPKLTTSKAVGALQGSIRFAKPEDFQYPVRPQIGSTQIFNQFNNSKLPHTPTGHLVAVTTPIKDKETLKGLEYYNYAYKQDPSSDAYKRGLQSPLSFANVFLKDRYPNIVIFNAAKYTKPTIKENAYIFDITATGGKNGTPDQKGKIVYAWTDKAAYFYLLTVAKEDWQPNLTTWQDMINSIQIE